MDINLPFDFIRPTLYFYLTAYVEDRKKTMETSLTKTRIELLLLFILYLIILPRVYMDYDMGFWRQWALYLHQHGLQAAYAPGSPINYFPIYVYGLYFYDLLQGTDANIIHNINSIKILFICFDFLPIVVLCAFTQRILSLKIPYLFLLLNVAYVFNSLVWGQIDSIYTNLAFLAIVTGIFYPTMGLMLYVAAVYTKPQAIEFLPVILLVLYYSIRSVRALIVALVSAGAFKLLILLPFLGDGGVSRLIQIATNVVGLYHNLSISAFNVWYLIARGNPYFINDTDTYIGLSYRLTGLILFAVSGILAIVPLIKKVKSLRKNNQMFDEKSYALLFLSTGMLCLFFFYFNTQMHERYAHPIIIFFFFYGVASKNYRLFALASIPYFISLDKAFSFPDGYLPIVHYKFIFASRAIAIWYTVTVGYGSCLLYKLARNKDVPEKGPAHRIN